MKIFQATRTGVWGRMRRVLTYCTRIRAQMNHTMYMRRQRLMHQAPNGAPNATTGTHTHQ